MPVFCKERYAGRSGEVGGNNRHEDRWVASGYPSQDEAVAAVLAVVPETMAAPDGSTLYRGAIRYEEVGEVGRTEDGDALSLWEVSVGYEPAQRIMSEEGTTRIEFDTTGGTLNVTQSLKTQLSVPSDAPNTQRAINNDGEDIKGVDIVVPVFKFTVVKVFDKKDLPKPRDLFDLTGTTCPDGIKFKDSFTDVEIQLQQYEGLFMGARVGGQRPDGLVEVTYSFEGSPNRSQIEIGTLTVPAKFGWDYIWVRYQTEPAGAGATKSMVSKPLFAKVEKVYPDGAWAKLKVGTVLPLAV